MSEPLDVKAIRTRMKSPPYGVHISNREYLTLLGTDLPACLDVIEQMARALEKAVDTFKDIKAVSKTLRHETMGEAAGIAEESTRVAVALVKR